MLRIKAEKWNSKKFKELGRGGEAVIYLLKPDTAAKIFLLPTDPQYKGLPGQIAAAKVRLEEMQTKLVDFPKTLSAGLVAPKGVLLSADKKIFGYVMPYIDGTSLDKLTKTGSALTLQQAYALLLSLYELVEELHQGGIIIGDFNENNIIVSGHKVFLIDADSMQFGKYQCRSFIPRFAAPELLKVIAGKTKGRGKNKVLLPPEITLAKPFNESSDWYSFLVIAMRLIVHTDPFGGVAKDLDLFARMKDRITIFDQRVTYPLIAKPLSSVPRPLLMAFYRAFKLGERFKPDKNILDLNYQPAAATVTAAAAKKKINARKKKPATTTGKGVRKNARAKQLQSQ